MRDHIHPPKVSVPSYTVPPSDDIIIKPYIVPLLPTFHGIESENPYSVKKQLGLGELKPTTITLYLADRSMKIPKGIVEDVLVKVDKFYYLVDFVVFDTEPMAKGTNHLPIILGRPFFSTSNAIINCRNGVMQLTFGNMTLELNIFHLSSKHKSMEEQEPDEVCLISPSAGKHSAHKLQEELMKNNEVFDGESSASVTPPAPLIPPAPPEGKVLKTKGQKLNSATAHLTSQQTWRDFSSLIYYEPEGLPK